MLNSFGNQLWRHVWNGVYQGSSVEMQCLGFLLRAGHVGNFLMVCFQIPDFQKESINCIVCVNGSGIMSHFSQGMVGISSKGPRANFGSMLSKDSSHARVANSLIHIFLLFFSSSCLILLILPLFKNILIGSLKKWKQSWFLSVSEMPSHIGCVQCYSSGTLLLEMATRRVVAARLCRSLRLGFRCEVTSTHHGVGEGIREETILKATSTKGWKDILGDAFWLFSP